MKVISLFILTIVSMNLFAQNKFNSCETIFLKAKDLFIDGQYQLALNKLAAYKLCAPTKVEKADSLIIMVYKTITQQKIEAENEKNRATKAEKNAESKADSLLTLYLIDKSEKNIGTNNREALKNALEVQHRNKNSPLIYYPVLTKAAYAYSQNPQNAKTIYIKGKDCRIVPLSDKKKYILYYSDSIILCDFTEKNIIKKRITLCKGNAYGHHLVVRPDASSIVKISGREICIFDTAGNFKNSVISDAFVNSVQFSADSKIACICYSDGSVQLNQVDNLQDKPNIFVGLNQYGRGTPQCEFSPNGSRFIVRCLPDLFIYDRRGILLDSLMGNDNNVQYSYNDSKRIIFGNSKNDRAILILDSTGKPTTLLNTEKLERVFFSKKDERIFGVVGDTLIIWDSLGNLIAQVQNIEKVLNISSKNEVIIAAMKNGIEFINFQGKVLRVFKDFKKMTTDEDQHYWDFSCDTNSSDSEVVISLDNEAIIFGAKGNYISRISFDDKYSTAKFLDNDEIITYHYSQPMIKICQFRSPFLKEIHVNSTLDDFTLINQGKNLLVECQDKTQKIFNLSGRELFSFKNASRLVYSADDSLLYVNNKDSTVTIVNLNCNEMNVIKNRLICMPSINLNYLYTINRYRDSISILKFNGEVIEAQKVDFPINSIAVLHNDSFLVISNSISFDSINYLKAEEKRLRDKYEAEANYSPLKMLGVAYNQRCYKDSKVELWSVQNNKLRRLCNLFEHIPNGIEITPLKDNKNVLVSAYDPILLNLITGEKLNLPKTLIPSNYSSISKSNSTFIYKNKNDSFFIYRILDKASSALRKQPKTISVLRTSINNKYFATVTDEKKLQIWKENGALFSESIYPYAIKNIEFSKKEDMMTIIFEDGTALVQTIDCKMLIDLGMYHKNIIATCFAKNDKNIITVSKDGIIKIWELPAEIISYWNKSKLTFYDALE